MPAYIIQDKHDDPGRYIASLPTFGEAVLLTDFFEGLDRSDGTYDPDRYLISKREYCYSDFADRCGHCHKGICLLERPDTECPKATKIKAGMKAAADRADQQSLMPAT